MGLPYDSSQPWSVNIDDLASKLESVLRERATTRPTIAPFPSTNVPSLIEANEQALANFDKETQTIQWQASAARNGYLWFDPDSLRTPTVALDGQAQEWRREAAKRGKIVKPEEYAESRHSATHLPPLQVRRAPAGYKFPSKDAGSGYPRV